jgi:hypothetical protein
MLKLRIYPSQKFFFLDKAGNERLFAGLDRARAKVLLASGAIVRTIARRSLKPARRRKLSELDPVALKNYRIAQAILKKKGLPAPKLPVVHSLPGEPPRMIVGYLKKFLYFNYDKQTKSVLIGPAKLEQDSSVPNVLEYGGMSEGSMIKPRPYMGPANEKAKSKYLELWKDSIK